MKRLALLFAVSCVGFAASGCSALTTASAGGQNTTPTLGYAVTPADTPPPEDRAIPQQTPFNPENEIDAETRRQLTQEAVRQVEQLARDVQREDKRAREARNGGSDPNYNGIDAPY